MWMHSRLCRACPHVDAQQALIRIECDRLGVAYQAEPNWFRDRQLAEYQAADLILVPSDYSRRSFPPEIQSKVLVAPLSGRPTRALTTAPDASHPREFSSTRPFTFGTVGGQPLRKGFLYLLQAWERLKLPNAQLLLRTDADLHRFPALDRLLRRLPNVEVVRYSEHMSDFYTRCDGFVLATIDDGFGMVLLEAMAHGLPAVATSHCGSAELFTPGEDLLIVPPQDADALHDAMGQLYASIDLREKLRANSLQTLHSIEGDGTFKLYSEALDSILRRVKERAPVA